MNPVLHIFRKELRDMFRDKRVRTSAFFMPILLIVGMLYMFGSVIGSLAKPEGQRLYVIRTESALVDQLKGQKFRVEFVESVAAAEKMIRDGKAKLVIRFNDPTGENGQTVVDLFFDPKEQMARITSAQLQQAFQKANEPVVKQRLAERGLSQDDLTPVKLVERPVTVGDEGGAGEMIVSLLPYLIVIWAFYGGFSIATDLVAGEKEKSTLETLLITPVRRTQVVLGKFFSLATVCLLSSLSSVVGLIVYAILKPPGSAEILKDGMGVTPEAFLIILLVLIPTVALFASILIAVSSFARNSREAQTHLSLLSFVVIMPAIASQFIGLTDMGSAMWVNLVPVLNTANNIRMALLGKAELTSVLVTMGVSLGLAVIALVIAIRLFNREQVLTRV